MHEYQRRILLAAPALAKLSGFSDTEVQHDDKCAFYLGAPVECRCDPWITVTHGKNRYRITAVGELEPIKVS